MLTFLFWLLFILWLFCSLFLVLVILNQEPKGGGVGGIFAQGSAVGESLGIAGMQKQLRVFTRTAALTYFIVTILLVIIGTPVFKPQLSLAPSAAVNASNQPIQINVPAGPASTEADAFIDPNAPATDEAAAPSESAPAPAESAVPAPAEVAPAPTE